MGSGKVKNRNALSINLKWLPNALTAGNLVCGFAAILISIDRARHLSPLAGYGAFNVACWLVILGGVLDLLDGRAARLFGSTGPFGGKLDSFADMVTFGLAPSMIMACTLLKPESLPLSLGWLSCGAYFFTAVYRLARYNVSTVEISYGFMGLPSPAAAATVVSYFLVASVAAFPPWVSALAMLVTGALMVCPVPYAGLKQNGRLGSAVFIFLIALGLVVCYVRGAGIGVFISILIYDLFLGWFWALYLRKAFLRLEKRMFHA